MTVSGGLIRPNDAQYGSGIYSVNGVITVYGDCISDNAVMPFDGSVYIENRTAPAGSD